MGHVLRHGGVVLMGQVDESGAAGGREEALLHQLLGFVVRHGVRAPGGLLHPVEAQLQYALVDLLGGDVRVLRADGGRDHRVGVVDLVVKGVFDDLDGLGDEGLVRDRAEGALVYARAAGHAFLQFDFGLLGVGIDGDGLGLAGLDAGPLQPQYRAVGAGLRAAAALHALVLVDGGVAVEDAYGVLRAGVHAVVGDAAAAGLGDGDAVHRALVAGDGQHLHHVGVARVAAQRQLHTLVDDGPLLVDAAAHGGLGIVRYDPFGDGHGVLRREPVVERQRRDLPEHLVS